MGTGAPDFGYDGTPYPLYPTSSHLKYTGGWDTWQDINDGVVTGADADGDTVADDWIVIRTLDDFRDMAEGSTPSRVLGIPEVYYPLQLHRSFKFPDVPFSVDDPFIPTVPTLAEMTKAALNVLDNDEDGLFLMVEGGAVDYANHYMSGAYMIEEQADFNRAVEAVMDWVQKNSNWGETLVIVTTDHDCGYIYGPGSNANRTYEPILNNGAGNMPGLEYNHWFHSNSLVPFFAKGDAARLFKGKADEMDKVYGPYIDNTEIFEVIQQCLK
jgi:alkaline phosphatase